VVMAVGRAFEAITALHPWEWLYGERDYDEISRTVQRWGVTRAWGCCAHPIYFGFLQVLFSPWLFRLWHKQQVNPWLCALPLLGLIGVFVTGSRAALLAYLALPILGLVGYVPKSRWPLLVITLVLSVIGIAQYQRVMDLVTRWGETVNTAPKNQIIVNDQPVQMTGTMTRLYLLQLYRRAAYRAGWLGFGTEAVTGFPVNVPVGPEDRQALSKVRYIDNEFMLLTLRFGWLGGALFAFALGLAAVAWVQRSGFSLGSTSAACFYAGCMFLTVGVGLLTVWMPHDIGFPLLWWMGGGGSKLLRRQA
jgi:hypothetical protein